jgi:hypothetical protein
MLGYFVYYPYYLTGSLKTSYLSNCAATPLHHYPLTIVLPANHNFFHPIYLSRLCVFGITPMKKLTLTLNPSAQVRSLASLWLWVLSEAIQR